VSFNLSRVDVRQLVEQSIESNRGFSESYGVSVRSDFASMTGEVNADPDRLAQVVTNLLSNAIKFSPSDGEVVVAVETIDNIVRISVRDHGSGIPADFRPHVFEKFAQADATNSRQKGGTGLGLSIVKQIVERLGGNVGFDDAPNRGTIFYIELPGYVEAVNTQRDSQASVSIPRIATAAVVLQHIRRPRVLHVDDDSEVLTAVSHALTAVAEVVSASSIADARHAIEADQIDLAVLDIFLGPESGLDLLPDLQVADGVMIPVIVFSADVTGVACDEQVQVTLSKLGSSLERLVVAVRDRLALSAGHLVEETVL
jgi:anti-sigma regulatory factor (Ser/Thr protein kinase)